MDFPGSFAYGFFAEDRHVVLGEKVSFSVSGMVKGIDLLEGNTLAHSGFVGCEERDSQATLDSDAFQQVNNCTPAKTSVPRTRTAAGLPTAR